MLLPSIFQMFDIIITIVVWSIFLMVIFSWLVSFNVLDRRNQLVRIADDSLYRFTNPILRPVRNRLPSFGGVDVSPIVVALLLNYVARPLLWTLFRGLAYNHWSLV